MNNHQENTTTNTPYVSSPRGYALSGKIMLTAIIILFAVVLIMVCVHIYARCYILRARRRRHRRTHLVFYIDHHQNQPNTAVGHTHKLDPAVLKSLPTFSFSKAAEDTAEMVSECAVCLSEFEPGEKVRSLPKCKHCFHVECIDMWFYTHSTCPLCRAPVEAAADDSTPEVVVELGESTPSQLSVVPESSEVVVGPSSSRKGVPLLEVPRRSQSFSFTNSDESGPSRSPGLKSPTSRILSLKRILSREKRSPLGSPSGTGSSCELDVELGRVDSSSQVLTPS